MASDLKTHPDTDNPALNGLAMIGMIYVTDGDSVVGHCLIGAIREGARIIPSRDQRVRRRRDLRWEKRRWSWPKR